MNGFNFFQFIGGVAVFIYAMMLVESSLKSLSGRTFKKFLQKQMAHPVKVITSSTIVTALLQSSSVVILMMLSFVGAGLINLRAALASTLGANLGTTLDSWVIALVGFKINFSELSYVILAVALAGLIISNKNTRLSYLTTFLIGFALIFVALEWLKGSVDQSLETYLGDLGQLHYLVFIPVGFIVTAVIQSSSVMMAITLVALYNQLIPFNSAAAIVIGAEVGTSVKFLIASIKGVADKKRVAWGNFIINFFTMIIAAVFLKPLVYLIQHLIGIADPLTGLVVFQSGINLVSLFVFYPFLGLLAGFLEKYIHGSSDKHLTFYIHKSSSALPGDSLDLADKEIVHLLKDALNLNKNVLGITEIRDTGLMHNIRQFAKGSGDFEENYEQLKLLQGEIIEYIAEIPGQEMNQKEIEQKGRQIDIVRHILRSAKNLKDVRHNFEEFNSSSNDEVFRLYKEMISNARIFYNDFSKLLNDTSAVTDQKISEATGNNKQQYEHYISALLASISENKINELDSSSMINAYREVYSSNKALIRALADLRNLEGADA